MSKAKKSNRGPGRPAKTVKYPDTVFTVEQLFTGNPGICKLTIRKNVKSDLTSGKLVTLSRPVKTGKAGRPSVRYSTKASYDARLADNIAKKAVTPTAPTTEQAIA